MALLGQPLDLPEQTRLQMVKKELSSPGCDCLEMPDIIKSRILSTMMSLFLFPGDDKDNSCGKGTLWVLPALPRTAPEELRAASPADPKDVLSPFAVLGMGLAAESCVLGSPLLSNRGAGAAAAPPCAGAAHRPGEGWPYTGQGFGMPQMDGLWGFVVVLGFF